MPVLGMRGNVFQMMTNTIGYVGTLFRRYGNVASIVRSPLRIVNPRPTPLIPALQNARGAGVVCVNGAELNREVLNAHDRYL